MRIRRATDKDLPAIIDLLKVSLGEGKVPKSETLWRWKHIANPFGPSPVLVAEESGKLVGVRAFMRWQWVTDKGEILQALRAVDTATHPDFQGRGIFKKLTLQLVEECQGDGFHFIFNTPNEKSRRGYLKMGWKEVGKIPVRIKLNRPFALLNSILFKRKISTSSELGHSKISEVLETVKDRIEYPQIASNTIKTKKDFQFLQWRYADCPIQEYHAIEDDNSLLIYYQKNLPTKTEMRIVDWIPLNQNRNDSSPKKADGLKKASQKIKPHFTSVAPTSNPIINRKQFKALFLYPFRIGPILTFRELNTIHAYLKDINTFNYNLGDFELF